MKKSVKEGVSISPEAHARREVRRLVSEFEALPAIERFASESDPYPDTGEEELVERVGETRYFKRNKRYATEYPRYSRWDTVYQVVAIAGLLAATAGTFGAVGFGLAGFAALSIPLKIAFWSIVGGLGVAIPAMLLRSRNERNYPGPEWLHQKSEPFRERVK